MSDNVCSCKTIEFLYFFYFMVKHEDLLLLEEKEEEESKHRIFVFLLCLGV